MFDTVRRKKIKVTPEEIVRQLWITYFTTVRNVNPRLIAVERGFEAFGKKRRFDLVLFDKQQQPLLLAEFKAPDVAISQITFDQIAVYNMQLNIPFALVSNGRHHYCFRVEKDKKEYLFLDQLPV